MQFYKHIANSFAGRCGLALRVLRSIRGRATEDVPRFLVGIRHGAFYEFPDAVAYHIAICRQRMLWETESAQGVVAGIAKVGNGVEQCAVKVEKSLISSCYAIFVDTCFI